MSLDLQTPVFRGLSDSLQCAINIENQVAVSAVLMNVCAAHDGKAISDEQFEELVADARDAGFDYV